jgi:hypothetical protein
MRQDDERRVNRRRDHLRRARRRLRLAGPGRRPRRRRATPAQTTGEVAHHVTHIVLTETPHGTVHAASKGLGVMADGSVGSVTYDDTIARAGAGWKITHRVVRPRRTPLQL